MNTPLLLLLACFLTIPVVHAQTSQGNMMVGGQIEIRSTSYQGTNTNNSSRFSFSPSVGYFINDNFALGATTGIYRYRSGTDQTKTVNSSFSLGPFARYYFFTSNDRFAFFGDAELTFGTDKSTQASGVTSRGNRINFTLSPGAAYFFNQHWAAELSFGWFSVTSVNPNTETDNDNFSSASFSISSFSPTLGVRYHLGLKN